MSSGPLTLAIIVVELGVLLRYDDMTISFPLDFAFYQLFFSLFCVRGGWRWFILQLKSIYIFGDYL